MKPHNEKKFPFACHFKNRQFAEHNKIPIIELATNHIKAVNHLLEEISADFLKRVRKHTITLDQCLVYFKQNIAQYVKWHEVCPSHNNLLSISNYETNDEIFQMYLCNIPWLHVAKSKQNRGYGLFASRVFLNEDFLGIYHGYKQN